MQLARRPVPDFMGQTDRLNISSGGLTFGYLAAKDIARI
jgi:hypothetical protein